MVTFILTGHRRMQRYLVHAAFLGAWASAEIALLVASSLYDVGLLAALAILWPLGGVALLWNCGRPGAGRETFSVDSSHLWITRAIGPFLWRRQYELTRIRRPRAVRTSVPPLRRFRIEFDCDGRVRRFGRNLTSSEALCLVSLIQGASNSMSGIF